MVEVNRETSPDPPQAPEFSLSPEAIQRMIQQTTEGFTTTLQMLKHFGDRLAKQNSRIELLAKEHEKLGRRIDKLEGTPKSQS